MFTVIFWCDACDSLGGQLARMSAKQGDINRNHYDFVWYIVFKALIEAVTVLPPAAAGRP